MSQFADKCGLTVLDIGDGTRIGIQTAFGERIFMTKLFSFLFESEYLSHILRDISRDDLGSNSIGIWLGKGGLSRERFIRNLVPMLTLPFGEKKLKVY